MTGLGRITPQINDLQIGNSLNNDQLTMSELQLQISSGLAINSPSDNPPVAVNILGTQAVLDRTNQYSTNAQDGLAFLGLANSSMTDALGLVQEIRQVTASATSYAGNQNELDALATRIGALTQNVLDDANTTYLGRPVFGGTTGGAVAFDPVGNYVGTNTALTRTVAPGVQLQAGVIGSAVFGQGGGATDLFTVLQQIQTDLQSGNVNAVLQNDEPNLDTALNQAVNQSTVIGSFYQGMAAAAQHASNMQGVLQTQVGNLSNLNMAQAITQLQEAQTTYQAALWSASQVGKMSLINFV